MDVPVQDHVSLGGQPRMMRCQVPGQSFFLGSIHGHWSILPEDRNDPSPPFTKDKDQDKVNFGLAVVVPAKKIREVLYHPELVEIRKQSDQWYLDNRSPTTPD